MAVLFKIRDWDAQVTNLYSVIKGFDTLLWKRVHQHNPNDTPKHIYEFQVDFPLLWIEAYPGLSQSLSYDFTLTYMLWDIIKIILMCSFSMEVLKHILTEFGIHYREESCL